MDRLSRSLAYVDDPFVAVGFDATNVFLNDPFFPDAPKVVLRDQLSQSWAEVDNWAAIIRCRLNE